jgi:hypothetical protein
MVAGSESVVANAMRARRIVWTGFREAERLREPLARMSGFLATEWLPAALHRRELAVDLGQPLVSESRGHYEARNRGC